MSRPYPRRLSLRALDLVAKKNWKVGTIIQCPDWAAPRVIIEIADWCIRTQVGRTPDKKAHVENYKMLPVDIKEIE